MEKEARQWKNGITLIALVITIIILIILAGVSIVTLTGDNGILGRASEAKKATTQAGAEEKVNVAYVGSYDSAGIFDVDAFEKEVKNLDGTIVEKDEETVTVEMDGYEFIVDFYGNVAIKEKVIAGVEVEKTFKNNYTDVNNHTATIPAGFTVDKELNIIDTGLVVRGPDGSEFVWVLVNNINSMAQCRTAGGNCNLEFVNGEVKCTNPEHSSTASEIVGKVYESSIGETFGTVNNTYNDNSGIREPAIVTSYDNNTQDYNTVGMTLEGLKQEYKTMINSVAKYDGFYISRYESSLSTATERDEGSGGTIQSKANVKPVTARNDTTSMWYGLYAKHKEYTGKNNSVGSSMVWLSQYDAMLNWIKNSGSTDKEKITAKGIGNNNQGSYTTTGNASYANDNINQIRDLGGNVSEWTLGAYATSSRIYRGGSWQDINSASYVDYNGSRYKSTMRI